MFKLVDEVMRSEFEKLPIIQEIITDEYDGLMFDERFSKYLCSSDGNEEYLNGAWMVWQHQQSKVDELTKQRDSFIKAYEIEMDKSVDLQKRLDALIQKYKDEDRELKLIDEWEKSQIYGLVASELEQALKGGSDE